MSDYEEEQIDELSGHSQAQRQYYVLKQDVGQLQQSKKQKLSEQDFQLIQNEFNGDNWPNTFKKIQKLHHYSLLLHYNQSPRIIWDLMTPIFTNLTYLSLTKNYIKNIEALQFINCQKLQELQLQSNQIFSIKPLSKIRWKNLKTLELQYNPIIQTDLSRMKVSSNFHQLDLQSLVGKKLVAQNIISQLAKFQTKNMISVYFSKQCKIGNFHVRRQNLMKKYHKTKIWFQML